MTKVDLEVYAPRDTPVHNPAYKCSIRTQKVCRNTEFFESRDIFFNETSTKIVLPHKCQMAVETKRWRETWF